MSDKPLKIVFAPGCFDNFEGTQEELDALIADLKQLAESGDIHKYAMPAEDVPPEVLEKLDAFVDGLDDLDDDAYEEYLEAQKKKLN